MKTFFEDPTLRLVLFELRDVLSTSEQDNPDDDDDSDTPFVPHN